MFDLFSKREKKIEKIGKMIWMSRRRGIESVYEKIRKRYGLFFVAFYIDCFCAEMLFSSLIGDFSFSSLHMFFFFLEKFSNFYFIFVFN